ncbi:MAG: MerR family transcriptional regulator [Candidatus Moranbacteria bacterium]|nr:MerR family transcriptional regulator [Candidatus Moranbacteria bacterium]
MLFSQTKTLIVALTRYSIRDLEQLTGIKAHTLRIWEKRYGVVTPRRTPTNIRYYTDEDLKKLLNISILNRHGFKISNIANLENDDLGKKIISITNKTIDTDSNIENLIIAMIELDEGKFEKILTTLIINLGFEDTFIKVIIPFFEKVGVLWQIGTINPAQEHFMTNLIRQKIIVAIDGLITSGILSNPRRFILYLPDGELHELGLLFYSYLIQKRGHKVIYLGQMVPFDDLIEIAKIQQPDAFLTIFTANLLNENIQQHLEKLSLQLPETKIFAGGLQFKLNVIDIPSSVSVIRDVSDFRKEMEKIETA